MSLKVGMLIVALVCSAVYGYVALFEITADPIAQLRDVMDLAGRGGTVSWVVFANVALRDRRSRRARAQKIVDAVVESDVSARLHLIR